MKRAPQIAADNTMPQGQPSENLRRFRPRRLKLLRPQSTLKNAFKVLTGILSLFCLFLLKLCPEPSEDTGSFCSPFMPTDAIIREYIFVGSCVLLFSFMCCPCLSLDSEAVDGDYSRNNIDPSVNGDSDTTQLISTAV